MTIFVYIIIFCLVFGLKNWTFFYHFTKYYYLCTQNLNKMTTSSIIRNKVAKMPVKKLDGNIIEISIGRAIITFPVTAEVKINIC